MIVLHGSFPLDPDRLDEALDLIDGLVDQSREEPGMIEYRATTDVHDPNVVRFFERYEDAEAFEAHSETDHLQGFDEAVPDLLAGEPEVLEFDVDRVTELEL